MYLISFLVPETHLEEVKNAMFRAGAGVIGSYAHCAWQTLGEGQFLPLAGSSPHLGKINQLERVAEYKVEMVCSADRLKDAVKALKDSHPYEVPAYQVIRCEDI